MTEPNPDLTVSTGELATEDGVTGMEPVDVVEVDGPPTGAPPAGWEPGAHADAYEADPAIRNYADEEG